MSGLASCGGRTVQLWDCQQQQQAGGGGVGVVGAKLSASVQLPAQPHCVRWNHTNSVVASAGDDGVVRLHLADGSELGCMPEGGQQVRIWDAKRRAPVRLLTGHAGAVTCVVYSPGEHHVASCSDAGELILHSNTSGAKLCALRAPNTQGGWRTLQYSPHRQRHLAVAGDDGTVHVWDMNVRSIKVSYTKAHKAPVTAVDFSSLSPNMLLSSGLDKRLLVLDLNDKRNGVAYDTHAPVTSIACKADGVTVAAGFADGDVALYDLRKNRPEEAVECVQWQNAPALETASTTTTTAGGVSDTFSSGPITDPSPLLGPSNLDTQLVPDADIIATTQQQQQQHARKEDVASTKSHKPRSPYTPAGQMHAFASLGNGVSDINNNNNNGVRATLRGASGVGQMASSNGGVPAAADIAMFSPVVEVKPITPMSESGVGISPDSTPSVQYASTATDRFAMAWHGSGRVNPSESMEGPSGHPAGSSYTTYNNMDTTHPHHHHHNMPFDTPTSSYRPFDPSESDLLARAGDNTHTSQHHPHHQHPHHHRATSMQNPLFDEDNGVGEGVGDVAHLGRPPGGNRFQASVRGVGEGEDYAATTSGQTHLHAAQLLRSAVNESVGELRREMHDSIQNLHLDLLRQFHIQQMELGSLVDQLFAKQNLLLSKVESLEQKLQHRNGYL
eukprot:jgi/Chlat1/3125/Chrsp21S03354